VGNRLFVGNLSWNATEEELRNFLGDRVTNVKIITDRETGRSRGFAFAETVSDEAAQALVSEFNGQMFLGRDLRINEAEERRPSSGGGGGYRSGGGGYHSGGPPRDDGGGRRDRGRRRRDSNDWDY
jgi:RNA recognition motif-containing protein